MVVGSRAGSRLQAEVTEEALEPAEMYLTVRAWPQIRGHGRQLGSCQETETQPGLSTMGGNMHETGMKEASDSGWC